MTNLPKRLVGLALVLGACCVAAALLPETRTAAAPARAASVQVAVVEPLAARLPATPASAPIEPAVAPAVEPVDAPQAAAAATLLYPDGVAWPAHNGVTTSLVPSFTENVPFAPITGTEVGSHGLTWYVHANGTRSTSFLDGNGEPAAMAYMAIDEPLPRMR